MRFLALATAGLVALAEAWTQPTGPLKGNPIYTPQLNQVVPKGKPFKITWKPTTQGTVTLVLLRGPSTNAVPQYAIAQKIPNNGHYLWTPKTNLENDVTHYGIQLIVDHNGQYQYSTQFGIGPRGHSVAADEFTLKSADDTNYSTEVVTGYTTYCSEATTVPIGGTTYTVTEPTTISISTPCTITHSLPTTYSHPTYSPPSNTTISYTHTPINNYTTTRSTYKPTHQPTYITYTSQTSSYATPTYASHSAPVSSPSGAAVQLGMSFVAGAAGIMAAVVGL